ncbi:MAG: RluA family pseudouridine synthase [Clostridiales bacterium]|nr:RluA family pseudouridine synthase [Clostridiales bacterium]
MTQERFEISPEQEEERLDKLLGIIYPQLSRSFFQKLIKDGMVLADGRVVKASSKLSAGQIVEVIMPDAAVTAILPEDIPLDILYEDDDVLIVNKPKGMVVHPSAGHSSGTLVNAVMYHCRDSLSGINGELRPGIVHRIDMNTTGSLIVCKNDNSHRVIAQQIKNHSVNRVYVGIVCGNVKENEGVIDAPIGRHPSNRKRMLSGVSGGRRAITHYRVLERFGQYTYMEFRLETGRTHQIRAHMSAAGHPLLGDEIYGGARKGFGKLQGQCLHAMTIGFIHPTSEEYVEFTAPLPEYFDNLLLGLRRV